MSAGAATVEAGVRTAAWAAAKSMTADWPRTMPTNGLPWRSKVPSLNGVAACCACAIAPVRASAVATTIRLFIASSSKRLVLHAAAAELVRQIVEARARQRHRDWLRGRVLPEPAVEPRERRRQRARHLRLAIALLVGLRVALRRAVGLGVELVRNRHARLPGEEQRFAFVEPVLVFHPLARAELEGDRLVREAARLRHEQRGFTLGPVRRGVLELFHLLADLA